MKAVCFRVTKRFSSHRIRTCIGTLTARERLLFMFRKDTVSPHRYPFAFCPDLETTFFLFPPQSTSKKTESCPLLLPRNARQPSRRYYPKVNICSPKCSLQNVFTVPRLSVLMSTAACERLDRGPDK